MFPKFFGLQDTWHGSQQVYTVLKLQSLKFQIFTAKFYKPLFRSIFPKSTHFS